MQAAFIPYIHLNDYLTTIRSGQLNNQLLDYIDEGGEFERQQSESFALDQIRQELSSYFYLDFELKPLLPFVYTQKYYIGDRIILDFPEWVASTDSEIEGNNQGYTVGDCVILSVDSFASSNGLAYICTIANSDTEFNPDNWLNIGKQYDIYFVNNPYPIFKQVPDQTGIGGNLPDGIYLSQVSRVCWDKRMYLCTQDSLFASHQMQENLGFDPAPNIFPNQFLRPGSINKQWKCKGEFYLSGIEGNLPFRKLQLVSNFGIDAWESGYRKQWTFGDNRSPVIIQIVIALSIYNLLGRNSFMLKERSIRRDWALRELNRIKEGVVTTLIPILQPEQAGGGVVFGGNVKTINTY